MIAVNGSRVDRHLVRPSRLTDQLSTSVANIPAQDLVAILRDPHHVVLAVPDRVAAAFERFHSRRLHGNRREPRPPKGVGFTDPLSGTLNPIHLRSAVSGAPPPHFRADV